MEALELLALVGRSREGDQQAFAALVVELSPGLRRYCRSFFNNWQDVDDALQDTWVKAWKSLPTLNQNGAFKTWLYRVARNICLDRVRSPKSQVPSIDNEVLALVAAPEYLSPENVAVQRSETERAWSILATLPSALRQAFVLVCLEELSYQEAARITNTSESTIRGRIARARKLITEAVS